MHIIGSLLDWLFLPQLKNLSLMFGGPWPFQGPQRWENLELFLKRSKPPLESLVLVLDWMSNEELIRSLELLPSLKAMTIRFNETVAEALVFRHLGGSNTQMRLCPILELIEINDIGDASIEKVSTKIQNIIASRESDGISPLRTALATF